MNNLSGFGNHLTIKSDVNRPNNLKELISVIKKSEKIIAYGNNKSYGDSSLYTKSIDLKGLDKIIEFNQKKGIIEVESGIMLSKLLTIIVPKGLFLHVTPGTKNITIGGAISSNIHGKNHHNYGSFINCVKSFKIVNYKGELIECSRTKNKELFYSAFGSMGLLGVIYSAVIELKKIKSSYIDSKFIKCENLEQVIKEMKKYDSKYEYSVAWIDTMAEKRNIGKGVLILGNHSDLGKLDVHRKPLLSVPFFMPNFLLNNFTIMVFNKLYHLTRPNSDKHIHYEKFFYPLDSIENWNRVYGKRGFTQYQFVIPKKDAIKGIKEILEIISAEKKGSFLSVLKESKDEDNLLSFPKAGYTLAMDLPIDKETKSLVDKLNKIVIKYKGRIYLTKDAFTSAKDFKEMYKDKIEEFNKIKNKYDPKGKFVSIQSLRVGLTK